MNIVLNELSVAHHMNCPTNEHARNLINQFVEMLHLLANNGNMDHMITTHEIHSFIMTSNYGIKDWLNDPYVKRNHKQFFRIVCGKKCSFIVESDYGLSEFTVSINDCNISGIGCLAAYEMNENTISLNTCEIWSGEKIKGFYRTLDEDTGEERSEKAEIRNISTRDHLACIQKHISQDVYMSISSGQDLWEAKECLFPNLEFCESVKDQLYSDPEKFHIDQVLKKLMRLQEYFFQYDGVYNCKNLGLNARTESDSVKNNPELSAMRYFKKPDGSSDYFYNHIGFSGKYCGRIHYLPDDANKKCIIGYIGKHLRTSNFKS